MEKIGLFYGSDSGNTQKVAEKIAQKLQLHYTFYIIQKFNFHIRDIPSILYLLLFAFLQWLLFLALF